MSNHMEEIQKSYFENLSKDLCSTCEGSQFMVKYMTSRSAISDLEKKVLGVIKDSDLSTAEAIGFMGVHETCNYQMFMSSKQIKISSPLLSFSESGI